MTNLIRVLALGLFIAQPASAFDFVVKLKSNPPDLQQFVQETKSEKAALLSAKSHLYLVTRNIVERRQFGFDQLQANPKVVLVENNNLYKLAAIPNDTLYGDQWALKNLERLDLDLGAEQAWDITTGSDQVTVAIIDTGIMTSHEDLTDNIWTNAAEATGTPGVDDDKNGFIDDVHGWDFYGDSPDVEDNNGHGTLCAGIIGARGNNEIGLAGINWNVKIMPIRFAYSDYGGTLAAAILGMEYAINNNAHIILLAWSSLEDSQLLLEMIERAQQKNILVVTAAGNDSNDNDVTPVYPASYSSENNISVASLDRTGALASYSNFGRRSVDVGAPGTDLVSTSRWDYHTSWDGGTSAAAAYVAGIAALLKAQDPAISFFDMKDRIVLTARRIASLRGKMDSPGMVSAYYALVNQVAPPDSSDPTGWNVYEETFETNHPYSVDENATYLIKVPNAKRLAVLFDQFETEDGYDFVTFKDSTGRIIARWSGNHTGQFSPAVAGDSMTIEFTSDNTSTGFGFLINKINYEQ